MDAAKTMITAAMMKSISAIQILRISIAQTLTCASKARIMILMVILVQLRALTEPIDII